MKYNHSKHLIILKESRWLSGRSPGLPDRLPGIPGRSLGLPDRSLGLLDSIDAQGLKIQGRGYLMFFAKIPRGGQGFQEELPGGGGGSPISGFIAFLLTSVLKFA